MNVLDPIVQAYMEGAKIQNNVVTSNVEIIETKLAWMLHIVGAILKVKQYSGPFSKGFTIDKCHGHWLICACITKDMVNSADRGSNLRVLNFFQYFRKSYIGDQSMHASKQMYVRLSELLGLHDHLLVLNVMIRKIATNLRCCTQSKEVLDQTLSLFLEMASGFMTAELLLKLDTIQYITTNHSKEQFCFMEDYGAQRRTIFYYIIGSLVFMEDSVAKF